MGRELELKYRATEAQIAAIRGAFGPFHEITMETTYYDTPERAMGAKRETLRRRYENGTAVYALKTYLPDGSHGEWECEAGSLEEALRALSAMGAPGLPPVETLIPICGAAFTRSCALLPLEGGTVDGANDHRIVMAAAIAATACQSPVTILGAQAVNKSYPSFWEEYQRLGGDFHVL